MLQKEETLIAAELLMYRRKREIKEACNIMESKGMFDRKKRKHILRIIAPCEVCGTFQEFLKIEVVKICDNCLEKGIKREAKEDREFAEALLQAVKQERNI